VTSEEIIDTFFKKDGQQVKDKVKRSILLAIQEDLKFCVQLPGKIRKLELDEGQYKEMQQMIPSFTVALLFCTGVDLLGKVLKKSRPPRGQNRKYFTDCARNWMNFSQEEAEQLWKLRNALVHEYTLNKEQILRQYGHKRPIRKIKDGYWEFYLHAMYSDFMDVSKSIHEHLLGESSTQKTRTVDYLKNNGFFYIAK